MGDVSMYLTPYIAYCITDVLREVGSYVHFRHITQGYKLTKLWVTDRK